MTFPAPLPVVTTQTAGVVTLGRRRSATGAEQKRRIQWGKDAGAKVAAAYQQMQEGR